MRFHSSARAIRQREAAAGRPGSIEARTAAVAFCAASCKASVINSYRLARAARALKGLSA